MKRKLRVFSDVAIICLSVCMFAFGVYAANTVSVTTSGTITFEAPSVNATVVREIIGEGEGSTFEEVNVPFTKDTTDTEYETTVEDALKFDEFGTEIVMKFTITNNEPDMNLNVIVLDETATSSDNISNYTTIDGKLCELNKAYNIDPKVDGETGFDNVKEVAIRFNVTDKNLSADLKYAFRIRLEVQQKVLKNDIAVALSDTTKGTIRTVQAGNTLKVATMLNESSQLNNYTGIDNLEERYPVIDESEIVSMFNIKGATTSVVANVEAMNTTTLEITSSGSVNDGESAPTGKFVIPMAVNNSTKTFLITSIEQTANLNFTNVTELNLPSSLIHIGYDFDCGSLNSSSICHTENNLKYVKANGDDYYMLYSGPFGRSYGYNENTKFVNSYYGADSYNAINDGVICAIGAYQGPAGYELNTIKIPESLQSVDNYCVFPSGISSSLRNVIIDSSSIYSSIKGNDYYGCGDLISCASTIYILTSIDDGSNAYLNGNYNKQVNTAVFDGKAYNVYKSKVYYDYGGVVYKINSSNKTATMIAKATYNETKIYFPEQLTIDGEKYSIVVNFRNSSDDGYNMWGYYYNNEAIKYTEIIIENKTIYENFTSDNSESENSFYGMYQDFAAANCSIKVLTSLVSEDHLYLNSSNGFTVTTEGLYTIYK